MLLHKKLLYGVLVILCLFLSGTAYAVDDDDAESGVVRHGVTHNIAADRKVEKVGGIYEPEGLDKYLKRKFDELGEKIDKLSQKVDALANASKPNGNPENK
ncbi:MAG: hypothetical protein HYZ84_01495 [Candidatus Omnitrophica bacterium]|nr:hypothetical protein [Candidatus Omnitrophota bacterium]